MLRTTRPRPTFDPRRRPLVLPLPLLLAMVPMGFPAPALALAQESAGRPLRGQASIVGRLTALSSGSPLEGAEIRLLGLPVSTLSLASGLFRLENLPGGQHRLQVRYRELESDPVAVALGPREVLDLNLDVQVQAVPVEELVVTVDRSIPVSKLYDFYRRSEQNPGIFIFGREIRELPVARTTDVLRRVPGVDVRRDPLTGQQAVTMGRRKGCVPDMWVDGIRAPFFDIDVLAPIDVAGIEIYRGNSEVPIEFKSFDRCGVIAVWTRDPGRPER